MNKLILIWWIIFSINAIANQVESYQLVPGMKIRIDVADKQIISLGLKTEHHHFFITPEVHLINEWNGFECKHQGTLLVADDFNLKKQIYKKTWEIQLAWQPGTDLSGCNFKISFPGMKPSWVELFMNY